MGYSKSMALKFRSTEAVRAGKGQRKLAFFFALMSGVGAHAQVTGWVSSEQYASARVMTADHWVDEGLSTVSRTEWAHVKSQLGVSRSSGALTWGLALTRAHYLSANRNALTLAAQNERNSRVDLSPQGAFTLAASSRVLTSTVMSVAWHGDVADGVTLALTPHVHWIHDYQRSDGLVWLNTSATQSRLQGRLSRVGTRDYGYLVDNQDPAGWGWGLDMRLRWTPGWGAVQVEADNALSRLNFSSYRFSNRQYDVNSSNGRDVVVSDIPSVQGRYGLTEGYEKLPVFWRASFSPEAVQGLDVGWLGLGSDARWTVGMRQRWGAHTAVLRTVEAQNWELGWHADWGARWSTGLAVSGTRLNGVALTRLQIQGVW